MVEYPAAVEMDALSYDTWNSSSNQRYMDKVSYTHNHTAWVHWYEGQKLAEYLQLHMWVAKL